MYSSDYWMVKVLEKRSSDLVFQCFTVRGLRQAFDRSKPIIHRLRRIQVKSFEVARKEFPGAFDGNLLFGLPCEYNSEIPDGIVNVWLSEK